MIAEHGHRRLRQTLDERAQERLSARVCQQVAGDDGEVGLPPGRPVDGLRHRRRPGRGHAQVEVRQVCHAQAVQRRRQAGHCQLQLPQPRPARLDEAPADRRAQNRSGAATEVHRAGIRPSYTH